MSHARTAPSAPPSPIRVLACPAQWYLSDTFGSESTWAFKIMEESRRRFETEFEAYCNWAKLSTGTPGLRIVALGRSEGKTVLGTARFTARYFRAGCRSLRARRFDVVHHMFPFGFGEGFNPLAVLGRIRGTAFVIGPIQFPQQYFHHTDLQLDLGLDEDRARIRGAVETAESRGLRFVLGGLQAKTLRAADVLVFDGEATRRLYLSAHPDLASKTTAVIPQGVDVEEFRPLVRHADRPLEIMTASYFTRRKGLDVLVRALPKIIEVHPSLKLRACGVGPELAHVTRIAEELGVQGNVIFQGLVPRSELVQFYSRARIYVQPSISETLPLAVLEALACGTPVVATKVGLMDEYFGGNAAVRLVPPGDPEALAGGVLDMLASDGASASGIARSYAERAHSWPVIAERWRDAYQAALANARGT